MDSLNTGLYQSQHLCGLLGPRNISKTHEVTVPQKKSFREMKQSPKKPFFEHNSSRTFPALQAMSIHVAVIWKHGQHHIRAQSPERAWGQVGRWLPLSPQRAILPFCSAQLWGLPSLSGEWVCTWNSWVIFIFKTGRWLSKRESF